MIPTRNFSDMRYYVLTGVSLVVCWSKEEVFSEDVLFLSGVGMVVSWLIGSFSWFNGGDWRYSWLLIGSVGCNVDAFC